MFNVPGGGVAGRGDTIISLCLGALCVEQKDVVGVGWVFIQGFERANRFVGIVGEDRLSSDDRVKRLAQGGAGLSLSGAVIVWGLVGRSGKADQ